MTTVNNPTSGEYDADALMKKVQEMYEKLPEGWSKNSDKGAPFVHEDGRESWKHPGRQEIQKAIKEMTGVVDGAPGVREDQKTLVKRYRMMLQSGVPPAAVEQRARLEGVDPAVIPTLLVAEEHPHSSDAKEKNSPPSRPKYGTKTNTNFRNTNTQLKRFRMMLKAGIPMKAVKQAAQVQGVDISELTNACGGSETAEKKEQPMNAIFTPDIANQQVTFQKGADLTRLVQKLVQTIKKRATASEDLKVELRVLYHALGSLRGVQHSRNVYNSTCDDEDSYSNNKLSILEIRSKRKAFLELAQSLAISAPSDWKQAVDLQGLDELVTFIEKTFKDQLDAIQTQVQMGTYDFDSLAQIYKPGTRVIAKNAFAGGVGTMCEVVWNRYEQGKTLFGMTKTFRVCFQFVVAVGKHFTFAECVELMENFDGKRQIKTLPFVPTVAYPKEELSSLQTQMVARGRLYSKIANSQNYMEYEKGSFYAKRTGRDNNNSPALHSGGRIMVDTQGSYEVGHTIGTGYDPMVMGIKYKYKEYVLQMRAQKDSDGGKAQDNSGMALFEEVPDEYLSMTWPAVVGFSFHSKVWGDVLVDGLKEIEFQDSIFDKIVLPPARKRMVKALVKHSCDSFNDVVRGKGEGSVFLLWGEPGVGKTLTAEAVCEMLHKPLYTVSLGQLGSSAAELETSLNGILTLCARWDALILLDEADIFLEKRTSTGSLERNAMVSVMLRLVEYFKGVLFLTSNRIDSLDPAFKTRITLALRYEALDQKARNQIWINLLESSGFGEALKRRTIDTQELAKHALNGREIKNSIRLAMALAEEDGEPLSQKFLLETVDILNEFNEQMTTADSYDNWAPAGVTGGGQKEPNSFDC